jgi:hypothetical protein
MPVLAATEHVSCQLHNPTIAKPFYLVCGWGLVGALKDSHPGRELSKLSDR